MSKSFLTPEFQQFFIELASNNHKDWFDENRKRYMVHVKKPFEELVSEFQRWSLEALKEPAGNKPGDAIFRINRDIRFSKDKTPYKLNRSALMSPNGRKDKELPSFYFEVSVDEVMVAAGMYVVSTAALKSVRTYIIQHKEKWKEIVAHAEKHFEGIQGATNKRLPKEWMPLTEEIPTLLNKQFYVTFRVEDEDMVSSPELLDWLKEKYQQALPIIHFLKKAHEHLA